MFVPWVGRAATPCCLQRDLLRVLEDAPDEEEAHRVGVHRRVGQTPAVDGRRTIMAVFIFYFLVPFLCISSFFFTVFFRFLVAHDTARTQAES